MVRVVIILLAVLGVISVAYPHFVLRAGLRIPIFVAGSTAFFPEPQTRVQESDEQVSSVHTFDFFGTCFAHNIHSYTISSQETRERTSFFLRVEIIT